MSEETNTTESGTPNERDLLLNRASQMGLEFPKNIPTAKLKDLINGTVSDEPATKIKKPKSPIKEGGSKALKDEKGAVVGKASVLNRAQIKQMRRKEASTLVRCNITCMNQAKSSWQGEIFTVSNSLVGEIKRMVPFAVDTHVEEMLLNMIRERNVQIFESTRDNKGNTTKKARNIKEFSVQVLPPLTDKQLNDLSISQARANAVED